MSDILVKLSIVIILNRKENCIKPDIPPRLCYEWSSFIRECCKVYRVRFCSFNCGHGRSEIALAHFEALLGYQLNFQVVCRDGIIDCSLYSFAKSGILVDKGEPEWPVCRELLHAIRARFPKTLLVAGGEHVTAVPEFSLAQSPLDAIVLGEGEETMADLLRVYEQGGIGQLSTVPGLVYRDANGQIQHTAVRPRIQDLNAIPRPAWDLLPIEEYLSRGYGFGVNRGRSIPVLARLSVSMHLLFESHDVDRALETAGSGRSAR